MATQPRRTRSGSERRQREKVVRARLTIDEAAQLDAAASAAGMTPSAFIRHQAIGTAGPRTVRRPPIERVALAKVLAQLGKCGSNLNQIARHLNTEGDIPHGIPDAIKEFRSVCSEIVQMLGRKAS